MMSVNEKLALADFLRTWRKEFGDNWVTAEQAIDYLSHPFYRDILDPLGIKSGDGNELGRRLDAVRNKLTYNFVVKRDVPYMQSVRWRVLLQDNRVKITDEERNDRLGTFKEAGLKIAPETADVDWTWERIMDPYGLYPDLPEEYRQTGRVYWARSPESDIWVEFGDLPAATRDALEKSRSKDDDFPWLWLKRDKQARAADN